MEAMVQGESSSPGKKYHRVAVTRHGGPDVLQVVEADLPERRAGEVRVNVLAPQFLPTISCSGAKVLPPARRACRSPQERTSLAWWAQVDTVNEAAAQLAVALVGSLDTVGQSGSRVGLGAAVLSWAR